jgi:hypothetical protein
MTKTVDIIVFGTGNFAARIVFDMAATAARPVRVAIAGRNAARLRWLRVAANARACVFERPAEFVEQPLDLLAPGAAEEAIATLQPAVVVQAASSQPPNVIATEGDQWSRLVAEGGLSATAIFQAQLTLRVAAAVKAERPQCRVVNCCFPDVVNSMTAARGLPVACGVGNVAILANAFAGELGIRKAGPVKVLAHYQMIGPWRRSPETRTGSAARVWIEDEEVADPYARFAGVTLTPEPAIEISGANGVPLMLAMAAGTDWRGHAPGPQGLPGGYPVLYRDGAIELDLPKGVGRAEAVAWNARFEELNGLVVSSDGRVHYTGKLYEALRAASPDLAAGFAVADLDEVYAAMARLRAQLQSRPA